MTPDLSTPEGRAELRALLLDATPLPWSYDDENHDDVQRPYRHGPQVVYSLDDCDIHPVADCSCNHTCRDEAEAAANGKLIAAAVNALDPMLDALEAAHATQAVMLGEIDGLASDISDALDSITKAESHIDVLEATIERLTAPVTAAEAAISADSYVNGGQPMHEVLDAFIARRKEQAP